ncbi:methenyltetrahydrofolate synthase domain-containing protein isoform X1 [Esox lucius]|uniref:Methenyltetrahydrofolate synthase domain-containing protein n=1 Tax=Esox lucius TaxID=8010 RepID=A0A3P8ZVS9_ESOLU|nr:methenyltetrahydrofolate synthase domain-containing protein isoform X1 [Esox lucius]
MEAVITINPGATKWDIREKVWDYIEAKNLANYPRPVHNRIPNFKGAHTACAKVSELQVFSETDQVKVDPDKPLEGARLAVLQARKTLLVPTPRLRTGLFNKIVPPEGASKEELRVCSTSQGVKEFSVPVGLDTKVQVDLLVVGSVAVSEKGYRIGKGEGFADMEYAMMLSMGAVKETTVVVTIVHDCQVLDIPEELIESHDLTVDYILTPTRVIKTDCQHPKPLGIIWTKLNVEMLEKIPVLKKLWTLEEEAGKDVTLGTHPPPEPRERMRREPRRDREPRSEGDRPKREPRRRPRRNTQDDSERDPNGESREDTEQKPRRRPPRVRREGDRDGGRDGEREGGREQGQEGGREGGRRVRGYRDGGFREGGRGEGRDGGRGRGGGGGREGGRARDGVREDGGEPRESRPPLAVTTVYLGGIPTGLRVSELKTALREREAAPLRLTWQGAQHRAFLDYMDPQAADRALAALEGLSLNGHDLQAELAKSQRGGRRPGPSNRRPRPNTGPKNTARESRESTSEAEADSPKQELNQNK